MLWPDYSVDVHKVPIHFISVCIQNTVFIVNICPVISSSEGIYDVIFYYENLFLLLLLKAAANPVNVFGYVLIVLIKQKQGTVETILLSIQFLMVEIERGCSFFVQSSITFVCCRAVPIQLLAVEFRNFYQVWFWFVLGMEWKQELMSRWLGKNPCFFTTQKFSIFLYMCRFLVKT